MAMNWLQFQAGMSLNEFMEQYGTEEQCEQALEKARWLSGYRRYQPWRAKRRLVVPSSREAALLTRRAHSARGEAK